MPEYGYIIERVLDGTYYLGQHRWTEVKEDAKRFTGYEASIARENLFFRGIEAIFF